MRALVIVLFTLIALGQLALVFFFFLRFCQGTFTFQKSSSTRPLLILVGGSFFLVGCGFGIYSDYLAVTGVRTNGQVIDYEEGAGKNGLQFAPVYVFTNLAGEQMKVTSSMSSSPRPFHVGAKIPIIYLASDPYSARPDTFSYNWLYPLIFDGVGAILVVVGITLPFWRI